jgi:hypothetical protein
MRLTATQHRTRAKLLRQKAISAPEPHRGRSTGEWIPVPADVVIKGPNPNGTPVAWWYFLEGEVQIRCYAPGGGV